MICEQIELPVAPSEQAIELAARLREKVRQYKDMRETFLKCDLEHHGKLGTPSGLEILMYIPGRLRKSDFHRFIRWFSFPHANQIIDELFGTCEDVPQYHDKSTRVYIRRYSPVMHEYTDVLFIDYIDRNRSGYIEYDDFAEMVSGNPHVIMSPQASDTVCNIYLHLQLPKYETTSKYM